MGDRRRLPDTTGAINAIFQDRLDYRGSSRSLGPNPTLAGDARQWRVPGDVIDYRPRGQRQQSGLDILGQFGSVEVCRQPVEIEQVATGALWGRQLKIRRARQPL